MGLNLISTNTLDALESKLPAEIAEEVTGFINENQELLIGLPLDWARSSIEATYADEEYAEAQIEIMRALSPKERNNVLSRNLKILRNAKDPLVRRLVLMHRAWNLLGVLGRKALGAALAAL